MKKYIKPSIDVENIIDEELIIATSGEGVVDKCKLGNEYNSDDESYSKQIDFSDSESIW